MRMIAAPYRPVMTLLGAAAIAAAALGLFGCSATSAANTGGSTVSPSKIAQDRQAILGMAGEYKVAFDFAETVAVRAGYELKEPYHSEAMELVEVVEASDEFISLQHLLVVGSGDDQHVIKHWRQDWSYQDTKGYNFTGNNVWEPSGFSRDAAKGAWVQAVYQVDDSPRYWGVGQWVHRDGVSTWTSSLTNRPLPRREFSKRSDYQILAAVNTHVVTADGWMHYQSNYKLDIENAASPVIALESGVNTYTKTTEVDFTKAREYWTNTHAYWAQVRAAWDDVFAKRETVTLKKAWKGDAMYSHIFDLADEYWGQEDVSTARAKIDAVIGEFLSPETVALP